MLSDYRKIFAFRDIIKRQKERFELIDKEVKISSELVMEIRKEGLDTEQVLAVLKDAENGACAIYDEEKGLYYAHEKIGNVTIWVSYIKRSDHIGIKSVYSHRMEIKENRK